jgi:hypothetical protein
MCTVRCGVVSPQKSESLEFALSGHPAISASSYCSKFVFLRLMTSCTPHTAVFVCPYHFCRFSSRGFCYVSSAMCCGVFRGWAADPSQDQQVYIHSKTENLLLSRIGHAYRMDGQSSAVNTNAAYSLEAMVTP